MKLNSSRTKGSIKCSPTKVASNTLFSESSCGNRCNSKILVAYASGFGSTGEVAKAIGKILCQGGACVDIKWIKNVKDLENYDAVIIGSAIQYDNWMPDARKFIATHQNRLSKMPVAFFFTCLTLSKINKKTQRSALAYAEKLYTLHPHVNPVSVGQFAGVLDCSKMSFILRQLFRIFSIFVGVPEGDYRDWDAIQTWAQGVHFRLTKQAK